MPQSPRAVAVFCASSLGYHKAFQAAALSLGNSLVDARRPLIYGSGSEGIMGIISGAVLQRGGDVTGVVPEAMVAAGGEVAQADGSIQDDAVQLALSVQRRDNIRLVKVDSMNERKVEMVKLASGFIALPGGIGTIEEVMDAMTLAQVGYHNKPIVVLNVLSYFNPLREMIRNGVRDGFIYPKNERLVRFVDGPADHFQHESYDWGSAALEAIDNWEGAARVGQYNWGNAMEVAAETTAVV